MKAKFWEKSWDELAQKASAIAGVINNIEFTSEDDERLLQTATRHQISVQNRQAALQNEEIEYE